MKLIASLCFEGAGGSKKCGGHGERKRPIWTRFNQVFLIWKNKIKRELCSDIQEALELQINSVSFWKYGILAESSIKKIDSALMYAIAIMS